MKRRRGTQRLQAESKELQEPVVAESDEPYIHQMPDDLLLLVFSHLAASDSSGVCFHLDPMRNVFHPEATELPSHAGMRSHPYLGQVCKRWRHLLTAPESQSMLYRELIIDFGHELVTSVHRPIAWSSKRPNDQEFQHAFNQTRISAQRIIEFVASRRKIIRKLVLLNSEGYWSEEGEFVSLRHKHNFSTAVFGMLLGLLHDDLEELRVQQCNNILAGGGDMFDAISCCPSLRRLHLLDARTQVCRDGLDRLSSLTLLEELTIGMGSSSLSQWLAGHLGAPSLPPSWANFSKLRVLALRGHGMLRTLPPWLRALPLESLTLAACRNITDGLGIVGKLATLRTLSLEDSELRSEWLPDFTGLTALTALSLSGNLLTSVPQLKNCKQLAHVHLDHNPMLKVTAPLTILLSLPKLSMVDFTCVHSEATPCWSDTKCTTMKHIATLARKLKHRHADARVMFSTK